MEAPVSASLGRMGGLLRQLHWLLRPPDGVSQGEIQDLINLLQGISLSLKTLSEAEDPSLTAKCWMKGVRELCYDTEDYLDESAANTDDVKASFEIIKARAEGVIQRLMTYKLDLPSFRKILTIGRRLAAVDADQIDHSRIDLKLENLLDIGKEKQLKVISVIGPGGVGKTTLVKKFYNKHRGNFHCQAFLRVSPTQDNMMLLTSLFTQIHHKEPSCNSSVQDLIKNTAEHLRDKRYLILLDGLWSTSIWHVISRALPVGECCSRILTTTQIEDVALACCSYQSNNVLKMEPLDDVRSRKLFFNRAFGSEDLCPSDLKEVSFRIIRKCGGLPLSTVNITSLLASEPKLEMKQWEHISDSLPSTLMGNPTSEGMQEFVKFVYNNLAPHLKTCLLYLSMYPAGHTVLKDDLVKQWVVEDFAGTEQAAMGYFAELVTGGMIEVVDTSDTGEVLSCTVHNIVLDLIVNESLEENFIITWNYFQSTIALRDKVRRMSVQFGGSRGANISASITMPKVRSLFFFGFSDRVPSSIGDYKFLRVLALHIWAHHDKTFDLAGVHELVRLRYLKVICNVGVKLPDKIQGQQCLEILEVYATLSAIPSDIGQLLKLRILNIAVMNLSSKDICSLQKLTALAALWVNVKMAPTEKIVFDKGGFSVLEFFTFRCNEPHLLIAAHAMPNLKKLNLCFNAHKGIRIEYLPCLSEISAIVGGGTVEAQRAQLSTIHNDLINPEVKLMVARKEENWAVEKQEEIMEEDCYVIQDKGSGQCEIMEEDGKVTTELDEISAIVGGGSVEERTAQFREISNDLINPSFQLRESRKGKEEWTLEKQDEYMGIEDSEVIPKIQQVRTNDEQEVAVTIPEKTELGKVDSILTKRKMRSSRENTKKGAASILMMILFYASARAKKNKSDSRFPMVPESSLRVPVQASTVGPSTLPAVEWSIATVGWIISPIIRRLLDKTFHGTISSQSLKMLQNLVTGTLPRLALALEAAESPNSGEIFQRIVTDLKTALYHMEDILDKMDYNRHHIQLKIRRPGRKLATDDGVGTLNQEPRSYSDRTLERHAQRTIICGTGITFCGLVSVTSAMKVGVAISNRTNPGRPFRLRLRNIMHKIEVLILEADETINRANVPTRDGSCKYAPNVKDRETTSIACPIEEVTGRDVDLQKIMKLIHDMDDHFTPSSSDSEIGLIGIIGTPGSGKTTLAQHVCKIVKNEGYFDLVIWIHVSQNFRLETIFKEIFEAAYGMVCPQYLSLDVLVEELMMKLSRKQFLLVLDDVRCDKDVTGQNLSQLISPLRNGRRGSKILATSQNADALSDLGPNVRYTTITISNLDDEAFFKLFMHYALGGARVVDTDRRKLVMIGDEIARKLKKSILAAKTVGRQLCRRQDVEFWISVRDGDLLSETMRVLWSCLHLDEQVKRCFAYCSIFPKTYHLYRDELVNLWVAEGFIKTNRGEEMEAVGQRYFAELVATSCLHLGGNGYNGKNYYLIPDLLHELVQKVAGSDCFRIENGWTGVVPGDVRHLFIETCDAAMLKENRIFELENLCTLIIGRINYEEGVFESIFKRLQKLRVLVVDILAVALPHIIVPASIGQLKHLRYLAFKSISAHVTLPHSFTKLYHMQVIDFGDCGCIQFSSSEEDLVNLINLRHLISNYCIRFPNIGRLTSLQTLQLFTVWLEKGYELKQLRYLNKLCGRLNIQGLENVKSKEEALEANLASKERLTELEMSWGNGTMCSPEVAAEVLEGLCPPIWLERLIIVDYNGSRLPNWMVGKQNGGPQDLRDLLLQRWSHFGPAPELSESFIHLRSLWLDGCSWVSLPDNINDLTLLEFLTITNCMNIRWLPTLPRFLDEFILAGCDEAFMTSCQKVGHPNWEKIGHVPNIIIGTEMSWSPRQRWKDIWSHTFLPIYRLREEFFENHVRHF